jgi:hypothetical protein
VLYALYASSADTNVERENIENIGNNECFTRTSTETNSIPGTNTPLLQSLSTKNMILVEGDPSGVGLPVEITEQHNTLKRMNHLDDGNIVYSPDGVNYCIILPSKLLVYSKLDNKLLHQYKSTDVSNGQFTGGHMFSNYHLYICHSERHTPDVSGDEGTDTCTYHNSIEVFTDTLQHKRSIKISGINAALIGLQQVGGMWYACFQYDRDRLSDSVHVAVCEMFTPHPITIKDVRDTLTVDIGNEYPSANDLYSENDPDNDDSMVQNEDTKENIILIPPKWTIRKRYDIQTYKISPTSTSYLRFSMDMKKQVVYMVNKDGIVGSFYHNHFSPSMNLISVYKLE